MKGAVRIISVLLCIALLCPNTATFADAFPFGDVDPTGWAYEKVRRMYDDGIMVGVSEDSFLPDGQMTRAMFVVALAALDGSELPAVTESPFEDVSIDSYYARAVSWAYQNGFVSGTGNGKYSPSSLVTREQVVTILYSYCIGNGDDGSSCDGTLLSLFYDYKAVAGYAVKAMSWAVNYGMISGSADAVSPRAGATRAQIACIFCAYLDYDPTAMPVIPSVHKVTYKNWDGTVLYEENVEHGKSATYRGEYPMRASTLYYHFYFDRWDKSGAQINSDTVITAVYTSARIVYCTVRFLNWDGSVLEQYSLERGKSAYYRGPVPTRPQDGIYRYEFASWDGSAENLTGAVDIRARFNAIPLPAYMVDIRHDVFTPGQICVNNSNFRLSDNLLYRIQNALANSGGRNVGFYLVDLNTKMTLGYNAQMSFQTASTAKLGVALYAYKRIAAGEITLDDMITYQPKHYCPGSGTLCYSASYGDRLSLRTLLHLMIYLSDNTAYYMVQDYVGYQGYNDMASSLGVWNMHTDYNTWGYLAPQELALFWQEIYYFSYNTWEGQQLLGELTDALYNFISEGLNHKYDCVAHKSGFNPAGYHDSAIVFGERPFIMVIMTSPSGSYNQAYLAQIAQLLDEVESEYSLWLNTHER